MKILITGSAGFIGSELAIKLLHRGDEVIGIDNHNDYYDPQLKEDRLSRHLSNKKYTHFRVDISNSESIENIFEKYKFDVVVNLAAQAGVRYSIENPKSYINSNLLGFANILEGCRHGQVEHLVYASSSSVYGKNKKMPFSTHDNVDHPISLYGATKKANELMSHAYSELYNLSCTGLRFFTVYGPWGRPDMAMMKFTKAILSGEKLPVFNYGKHKRDFTYIDDIIEGIIRVIDKPAEKEANWDSFAPDPSSSQAPWRIYNIGNNSPIELLDYIKAIENSLGVSARKELLPIQPGDVPDTFADVDDLVKDFNYKPSTSIEMGVEKFIQWYNEYYN